MRSFGKLVLALGAASLLTAPASAQGQGRGFGGGGGAGFLMAPNVQKDLKFTDEQTGKVQEVLRAVREKHQDEFAALRDLSSEERPAKMRELNKSIAEEVKTAMAFTPAQSSRFDQISLQARGLQAFADPAVAAKLKLTDEQKTQIREIGEASRASFAGAFNKDASEAERAEARLKMSATQKANHAKAHALLSADQKQAWTELTGAPIEIQYPPRPATN